jgi:hypothetical protein
LAQWQTSMMALPSASQAMPYGLLVPSATTWNSRVRGWTRHSAQVKAYSLPLLDLTRLGLKTPLRP